MSSNHIDQQVVALLKSVSEKIVLPYFQNLKAVQVEEKTPGDLVTIADRLSEELLSDGLANILPDAAIVGEEAVSENPVLMNGLNSELAWVIDPIDGTGNFAAGKSPFGIIIALVEAGQTIKGWLYDPLQDRLCFATKNGGAFIDGDRVSQPPAPSPKPVAALATGFMTPDQREMILQTAEPVYQITDIPRCAAEQYPRLVLGTNHISVFERTLPWDHAAGVLFLNEAGGKAARWDGTDYLPGDGRTGMLGASSPEIWDDAAKHFGHIFAT